MGPCGDRRGHGLLPPSSFCIPSSLTYFYFLFALPWLYFALNTLFTHPLIGLREWKSILPTPHRTQSTVLSEVSWRQGWLLNLPERLSLEGGLDRQIPVLESLVLAAGMQSPQNACLNFFSTTEMGEGTPDTDIRFVVVVNTFNATFISSFLHLLYPSPLFYSPLLLENILKSFLSWLTIIDIVLLCGGDELSLWF